MTCKHIDILAITVLLLGMALLPQVRHAVTPVIFCKQRIVSAPFHRPLVVLPKPPSVTLTID